MTMRLSNAPRLQLRRVKIRYGVVELRAGDAYERRKRLAFTRRHRRACRLQPAAGRSKHAQAPKIKVRGAEQDQLHKLDTFNLAIALKRAIYDAGFTCQRVTDAGFVGEYENLDMWTRPLHRRQGRPVTGRFSPDPTAAPRSATARTFRGPACRPAKSSSGRRAAYRGEWAQPRVALAGLLILARPPTVPSP